MIKGNVLSPLVYGAQDPEESRGSAVLEFFVEEHPQRPALLRPFGLQTPTGRGTLCVRVCVCVCVRTCVCPRVCVLNGEDGVSK